MSATKTLKVYNFQYLQDDNVSTFDLLCSQHAITIIGNINMNFSKRRYHD